MLRGVAAGAAITALGRSLPVFANELPPQRSVAAGLKPLAVPSRIWPAGIPLGDSGVVDLSSPVLVEAPGVGKLIAVGTTRRTDTGPSSSRMGRVVLLKPDGTIFQQLDTGGRPVQSSVSTGKLFGGSDIPYLVFGIGADVLEENPTTHAFSFAGSVQCWRFNAASKRFELFWEFSPRDDFPNSVGDGFADPVVSTPCLSDVNGDGNLEVFFGSWDRRFYLLDAGGRKLWEFDNKDTVWSSGAAGDLNGDGYPEIVCGGDIAANPNENPPITQSGGTLTCFDRFGKVLWRNVYDQVIFSSPAIGDVDGDGNLEVVVGTGDYYTGPNGEVRGNYVLCLDGKTGTEKWRFTTNGFGWASPALANILGKTNPGTGLPTMQIAISTVLYTLPLQNDSRVYLIDSNGSQVWSTRPTATATASSSCTLPGRARTIPRRTAAATSGASTSTRRPRPPNPGQCSAVSRRGPGSIRRSKSIKTFRLQSAPGYRPTCYSYQARTAPERALPTP
jgi:outer membrane protein assembly factor BamB